MSRRALAFISRTVIAGVSSMKIRASASLPAAVVSFGQSPSRRNPFLTRCESTRASEVSMRMAICSFDISRENIATGLSASMAACWAMLRAKEVFPMLGRPAMMMRSEFWNPDVISSIFSKPVGTPVIRSFFSKSLSIVLKLSLIISFRGKNEGLILFCDISKMECSASSSRVSMSEPWL